MARIRSHNIFNDLIVKPRFPIDFIDGRSLQPEATTLRKRRFGRFKVLAHMTSLFAVNHEDDKFKLLMDLFAAGLTGIDRIVLVGNANPVRLGLYIVVFVILSVVMLWFIALTVIEYLHYSTIVSVKIVSGQVTVLPAVTVCNMNAFKNDKLCNPQDPLYSEREEMCTAKNRDEFAYAMSRFKHKAAGNATLQNFLNAAMYTSDEIIYTCRYNREMCPPEWISDTIPSIYRYGRCFCIFCDLLKVAKDIDFTSITSPLDGLDLVLQSDATNFLTASRNHGFLVMIHDRFRSPDPNSDGVFIAVGMTTYLGLSMTRVNLLKAPFPSNCHTSWPKGEPYNVFLTKDDMYSEQGCRKICVNYYIMKDCKCLDLFKGVDYQQMLDSDTICVDEATLPCRRAKIQDPENVTEFCNCPKRCNEVNYATTMSQMAWNMALNEEAPTALSTSNVVLYADNFAVTEIVESQETSFTSALSTIGGFMNMFTGASYILIYEAVSILMIWLYKVCTMHRTQDLHHTEY